MIRDAAHALRIAYSKPLHADDAFGEVWGQLFGERHALAPDLMLMIVAETSKSVIGQGAGALMIVLEMRRQVIGQGAELMMIPAKMRQ